MSISSSISPVARGDAAEDARIGVDLIIERTVVPIRRSISMA
jgi:hypothetical protein